MPWWAWPSWDWPSPPLVTGSVAAAGGHGPASLVLGVIFVLPIGGADVPVLISLLNSFTGLAVAASGFTLDNNLLIIAGTLVGASGILLTRMMSKAMGRSLANVLFSAFGSVVTATGGADGSGETRPVKRAPPRTSVSCWPMPARWSSSPATAWPWPRPSTRPVSWPTC